jgi:hypothetical protein
MKCLTNVNSTPAIQLPHKCLYINAVQKLKNHYGANDLSVTVISNRKCYEQRPAKNGQTLANKSHDNTLSVGALYYWSKIGLQL